MKKGIKKFSKQKLCVMLILFVFLFSIFKIGTTYATTDSFTLTNVEIISKSDSVEVNSISYENSKIANDIIFHKVGDSVTYKLTIKNNEDENYTIKSVSDNNENEYIIYEYDSYEGTQLNSKEAKTFEITAKYANELNDVTKRNQEFSVTFTFVLENSKGDIVESGATIESTTGGDNATSDETGTIVATSTNPKTGDNINIYFVTSILSVIILVILSRKNTVKTSASKRRSSGKHAYHGFKSFSIILALAIVLPTISKAVQNTYDIVFENSFNLMDKLIVSYEIDGKINEMIVKYNDAVNNIDVPEKSGYAFNGWYLEDGTKFDLTTPIVEDITIKAEYKIINYTITYEYDGGISTNPNTYTVEDEITLNNPEKTDYIFTGWTGTDLSDKTELVKIEKGSIGDRKYIANYRENKYTLTATDVDSSSTPNGKYNYGTHIILTAIDKEGASFSSWSNGETTQTIEFDLIEDTTINPVYEPYTYQVVFNSRNGNGEMDNQSFEYGEEKPLTANTYTKEGFDFIGWSLNEDGTGSLYEDGQRVKNLSTENNGIVNLYAKWRVKLEIGDYVTYRTGVINNWRVFYREDGYIYLINASYGAGSVSHIPILEKDMYAVYADSHEVTGDEFVEALRDKQNWLSLLSGTITNFAGMDIEPKNIDYTNSTDEKIIAMGAPTLDLFVKSWNQRHPDDKLYTAGNDIDGYYLGKEENPTTYSSVNLKYEDDLYNLQRSDYYRALQNWIATKSAGEYAGWPWNLNWTYSTSWSGYHPLELRVCSHGNSLNALRGVICIPESAFE